MPKTRGAWQLLVKINDLIYRAFTVITVIALVILVVTVFMQVLGRYVFHLSTPEAEEIAIYSFMWLVLLAAANGVRDHSHLTADLLPNTLGPLGDRVIATLTYIVVGGLAVVFLIWGTEYAVMGLHRFSDTMGFQMFYMYVTLPICAFAMLLFLAERVVLTWRSEPTS